MRLLKRYLLCALPVVAGLLAAPSGCGGAHVARTAPPPTPASYDAFRENFLGDLKQANYWPQKTVTYAFVALGEAKSIRGDAITNQKISDEQKALTVRAFAQWQAVSAVPGPGETTHAPRILFREAKAGEGADIKVLVQDDDAFDGNIMGVTNWWLPKGGQELGAAVIRIRANLRGNEFHAVALHEIGHAWGADGHDQKLWAVMYATLRLWVPNIELGEREANSISADYARDATRSVPATTVPGGVYGEAACTFADISGV